MPSTLPSYAFEETRRLMDEGARWLPGGASSDYRLGPSALVLDRGEGALLFDVDGNRLIDYYCGAGPIILGHERACSEVHDGPRSQAPRVFPMARADARMNDPTSRSVR